MYSFHFVVWDKELEKEGLLGQNFLYSLLMSRVSLMVKSCLPYFMAKSSKVKGFSSL